MSEKHWMNQLFNSLHHWRKYSTTFGKVFKYLPETLYNKKRILNFVWLYFEQLSFASFFLSYSMNTTVWIILYSNNIAQHFNITQNWNVSIEKKTNSHLKQISSVSVINQPITMAHTEQIHRRLKLIIAEWQKCQ